MRICLVLEGCYPLSLIHIYPVNCIAHDVGFEDANHFTRVFRQAFGMTPNQYRKMSQE